MKTGFKGDIAASSTFSGGLHPIEREVLGKIVSYVELLNIRKEQIKSHRPLPYNIIEISIM